MKALSFVLAVMALILVLPTTLARAGGGSAPYAVVHTDSGFGALLVLSSDAAGNLYVDDQRNYVILKMSPSGQVLLRDHLPTNCGIPGLAVTPAGSVYASSACDRQIRHFSTSGKLLQQTGLNLDPFIAGLALDRSGHVYAVEASQSSPNAVAELTSRLTPVRTITLSAASSS